MKMKMKKTLGMGSLLVALAMTGCEKPSSTPNADASKPAATKEAAHTHGTGPNGGVVFDLGKYHAEFTVDHPAKECTVLFVTGDHADDKPLAVAATEFTLTIKETKTADGTTVPAMTVTLLAKDAQEGKAATFVGTDPGIGNVADFEGTVIGEIDGKPSQGTFKE